MNSRPPPEEDIGHKTRLGIQPLDQDKPRPIREWQQRYERYFALIGREAPREPYARTLERFLGKYPGEKYGHQFLRPSIIDYVETRLKEGASAATVRLELSAILGLFQFMMEMEQTCSSIPRTA